MTRKRKARDRKPRRAPQGSTVVTLLHGTGESEPEVYVFGGRDAQQRANENAAELVLEYLERKNGLGETVARSLRVLVENGEHAEAVEHFMHAMDEAVSEGTVFVHEAESITVGERTVS